MDIRTYVVIGVFIAGVIFNAGGFIWLARNHFSCVIKRLDAIDDRLRLLEIKVAGVKCKHPNG